MTISLHQSIADDFKDELRDGRLVEAGGREWKIDIEIRPYRSKMTEPPAAEAFWQAVVKASGSLK